MRKIKTICMFLCILLIVPTFTTVYADDSIVADSEAVLVDEKIYANATIDQDFADNRVLVVLDGNVGGINKVHDKSFFGSVDIQNIVDLTETKANDAITSTNQETAQDSLDNISIGSINTQINQETFRQILQIDLTTKSKKNVLNVIKQLEKIDGIVYVGPDYISGEPGTIPNDTYYNSQWALNTIAATNAWNITTGSSTVYVGVMDTGISSHPDLDANLVAGWDFFNENSITNDDTNGHGTHVAGIIGAANNNSTGISGVALNVKLVPLQIINDKGSSNLSDVIDAINYAKENNISIINHSWWNYTDSPAFKTAIANFPGLYVCIAGNAAKNIDNTPNYPASFNCTNMISVANTTSSDVLRQYIDSNGETRGSNYGATTVHLAAPGTSILSCYPESKCLDGTHGSSSHYANGYHYASGTSMAAPLVAGVAALMMSANPELTNLQIKAIILNTVDIIDYTGSDVDESLQITDKCVSGGRVNAYEAVRIAYELGQDYPSLSQEDINKANYLFYGSSGTIIKYLGTKSNVVIPQTINGAYVTKIGAGAFVANDYITNINIPSYITEIGKNAFRGCLSLKSVTIPSSITVIPASAFQKCTNLKNVTLPNTITDIGDNAFLACNDLETVALPPSLKTIGTGAFDNSIFIYAPYDGVAYNYAVDNNMAYCAILGGSINSYSSGNYSSTLRDIVIPSNFFGTTITSISGHAFDGAADIRSVEIPSTVTTIGYRSFRNCTALRTLIIPSSVTSISNSMNSIFVEGSTNAIIYCAPYTYISLYAESYGITCIEMTVDTASESVAVSGIKEADGWGTEYYIPETFAGYTVTSIEAEAFYDPLTPTNMTKVTVPETVESIGANAFSNSPNMTDIYIYSDETTIGSNCFNANNRENLTIHCYVTSPAHVYAMANGYSFELM